MFRVKNTRRVSKAAQASDSLPSADEALIDRELDKDLLAALPFKEEVSRKEANDRFRTAQIAVQRIKTKDQVEEMLAVQMTATHYAAMECARRAARTMSSDFALKLWAHMAKLMTLYARQTELVNKLKGTKEQKIIVEHLNVAAGGQAAVGVFEPAQPAQPSSTHPPRPAKTIDPSAHEPFEMADLQDESHGNTVKVSAGR